MFIVQQFGGCGVFNNKMTEVFKLREEIVMSRQFRSFVSELMRRDISKFQCPEASDMMLICLAVNNSIVLTMCRCEESLNS
jgi:hypothetical protein